MSVRLERLIRIYNRLRRGPVTIEIISNWAKGAAINVSDRQLYRDLNSLQHLHIADGENVVEFVDEKNRKTWKLEYNEPSEKVSQFDINSFFLLKNFAPYSILEHRKSSIEKFEKIIYKKLSHNKYQQLVQANELYLRRSNYNENMYGKAEHQQIEDMIWALQNQQTIIIESDLINTANIHLPPNSFPLTMHPLELVFHRGRVFVSGLATDTNQLLVFTIDKDLKFRLTNTLFNRNKLMTVYKKKYDALFGISDPVSDKVYSIKIEFTKSYGEGSKNFYWHHSQRWEQLRNGNYMLHLHCSIGRELIGFLSSGLDKVKVHQPKELKDLLIKKYKDTLELYKGKAPDEERANRDY